MPRLDKVNNAIKKEISQIIQEELKDPRIGFITVTRVDTSKDLQHAWVYFSLLGQHEQIENVLSGLRSSAGFIRKILGQRLRMRYTPELAFKFDDSIEYSIHIAQVMEEIKNELKEDTESH